MSTPAATPAPSSRWPWSVRWGVWVLTRPIVWPWQVVRHLTGSFRFWLLVIVGVIVLLVAYFSVADRFTPLTTDAYVQAYVVQMAPQVAGRVVRVYPKEGDTVVRG